MIFCRENITMIERVIADTSKNLVEAEFRLKKLEEEIAKEKVASEKVYESNLISKYLSHKCLISIKYVV